MTIRRTLILCCFALVALPALAAPEEGNMMKMTVNATVKMPGLPFNIPPTNTTQNVCTSAKKPDPREMMKQQKDCQVSDYREVGDTISYRMQCSGEMQLTGEGSIQLQPNGNLSGKMHLTGSSSGQSMEMNMVYEGQRTGSCDYQPPAE